jgi:anti-sigma regulatory factor (Ser/Thr protein kinase)
VNPQLTSIPLPVHPVGVRTAPGASFQYVLRRGFDMVIERSAGSGDGAVAAADALSVRDLRRTIRVGLVRSGLSGLVENAELLVSELVTNAFRHGRGDVGVRMLFKGGQVRFEVRDSSDERPALRTVGVSDEGGRGLVIVRAVADDWGISDDGMTTWCSLNLYPRRTS